MIPTAKEKAEKALSLRKVAVFYGFQQGSSTDFNKGTDTFTLQRSAMSIEYRVFKLLHSSGVLLLRSENNSL